MDNVSDIELRTALSNRLHDWTLSEHQLVRTFEFSSFKVAMDFVMKVASVAEDINHHPDITINYNKVTMRLTSHDAGGITRRDLRLAGKINEIAPALLAVNQRRTA